MSDTLRCPSCGQSNPAGSESCAACNFPLADSPPTAAAPAPAPAPAKPAEPRIERPLPFRPKRAAGGQRQSLTLWLFFATVAAAVVIYYALQANIQRVSTPVEGATPDLQKHADELRSVLMQDSTNVQARNDLADILYDTANWPEAITQYRSVIRQDSSRVNAIVDLGVCYFNLSQPAQAKEMFLLALVRQPDQPVALFNLGIVAENSENDPEAALKYYHRAVQAGPPQSMMEPLTAAIRRVQQKLGRTPPPLDGAGMPGGMPPGGAPPPAGR